MEEKRYCVCNDLQGGEFGMYRDYTIDQWRKQAMEWCFMDENWDLCLSLIAIPDNDILDFISELWDLEFRKIRKDKKISEKDICAFNDHSNLEYFNLYFPYVIILLDNNLKWEDIENEKDLIFITKNNDIIEYYNDNGDISVVLKNSYGEMNNSWYYEGLEDLKNKWNELLKELF